MAAAVAAADAQGDHFHVEACPRCKQAIKLPLDQLRRALPADWTPASAPAAEAPAAPHPPEATNPAEPAAPPAPKDKPRHRRHGGHKAE